MKAIALTALACLLIGSAPTTATAAISAVDAPPVPRAKALGANRPVYGTEKVVVAQLIHRHGARSPLPPANSSVLCPDGCGLLTYNGRSMLTQLGALLKGRYASEGFFKSDSYDPTEVFTRSTGVDRTIQSADSVLRGLYPNMTAYYPMVYSANKAIDRLLQYDDMPGQIIYNSYNSPKYYAAMKPLQEQLFPDQGIINTMAAELHLSGYCSQYGNVVCLVALYDTASCLNAQSGLDQFPTIKAAKPSIDTLYRQYVHQLFYYNASVPRDVLAGSTGQPIAQQMVANMRAAIGGSLGFKLMHYSGHDTTVAPFAVTIGAVDETLPVFGQMYLLDLVEDNGAYYVRGTKGAPQQTPGPYSYMTSPLTLGGITTNGTYYTIGTSASQRMPIDDFARFVDASKGTSPKGMCYLPDNIIAHYGIDAVGTTPSNMCVKYRMNCMQWACPKGARLDFTSYECLSA